MAFQLTTATRKIQKLSKKIRAVQGGTSASKTISIELCLIHLAQSDETPTLTSIVAESVPHLKRGAMRDFKNILKAHGYWQEDRWNATDSIYTFETGSQIEFFSADNASKLRGGRRDRLHLNEANNMSYDSFNELEVRTKEFVFLDWNPTNEFWFYTEILPHRDDVEHITLTYKDNEALSPEIVNSIEQRKHNKNWWQVYGLGQLGEVESRIFTGWAIIDEIPHVARLIRRGLDFGYTNDPTAMVAVYEYNGGFILDEELYRKGMQNKTIADLIEAQTRPDTLVIADSSEPKSIDEIKSYGINIIGAEKGKGSVNQGIDFLQSQNIFVTKRSVNLLKEYRNYLWITDRNGKITNSPEDCFNHLMDATRYALNGYKPKNALFEQMQQRRFNQNRNRSYRFN